MPSLHSPAAGSPARSAVHSPWIALPHSKSREASVVMHVEDQQFEVVTKRDPRFATSSSPPRSMHYRSTSRPGSLAILVSRTSHSNMSSGGGESNRGPWNCGPWNQGQDPWPEGIGWGDVDKPQEQWLGPRRWWTGGVDATGRGARSGKENRSDSSTPGRATKPGGTEDDGHATAVSTMFATPCLAGRPTIRLIPKSTEKQVH
jgi:hypothetical protein